MAEPSPLVCSGWDDGWRIANPGRAMFAAADRFVRDKLDLLRAGGFVLTDAQAIMFQNLDRDGTRLTTLATRANLTKQSMIELVHRAERMGLVRRDPDPGDGRARIIAFTSDGLRLLDRLRVGVLGAERRMATAVGKPFLATLKRQLVRYVAASDSAASVEPVMAAGNPAWRTWSVGRVLPVAARRFALDTLSVVRAGGYGEVNEALLTLFRLLDRDGTRLTDLSLRARMTKPAMAELVDRAAALGLVERRADPSDGRAKTIAFTTAGATLLEYARDGVRHAEERMAAVTGEAFVTLLVDRLHSYAEVSSRGQSAATSPLPRA